MSSTNRGAVRNVDDLYQTPPDLAALICKTIAARHPRIANRGADAIIVEPGCGEGSFLDAFKTVWPNAQRLGLDLNPALVQIARENGHTAIVQNVLEMPKDGIHPDTPINLLGGFDAVIGNPPFSYADDFIRTFLPRLAPGGVLCFLLRMNYSGGQERFRTLWKVHKPSFIGLFPVRPGFTPDGKSDSVEFAMFLWEAGYTGPTVFDWIDNTGIVNRWTPANLASRRYVPIPRVEEPIAPSPQTTLGA